MLLWSALLCLFSATLVASQFTKPGVLADYNPITTLQPMKNNLQNQGPSDDLNVIRGLLRARQGGCPTATSECNNPPGRCCPDGTSCCPLSGCCEDGSYCYKTTGCCPNNAVDCEGNSCCTPDQTCCSGGGCCDAGSHCVTVNGVRGCCPDGETCGSDSVDTPTSPTPTSPTPTSPTPQCGLGYVLCDGEDFCCLLGFTCFRDSAGDPMCSLGGVTTIPPQTLTSSSEGGPTTSSPSVSSSISRSSSTSLPPRNSSSTSSLLPTSSRSSNNGTNGGATSPAISAVVDVLLASLAGVGAFIFLF